MKKHLFSFLLGGLTFLCIGAGVATSTEILTVKPTQPKTVVCLFDGVDIVAGEIKDYNSKGFVTKSTSISISPGGKCYAFVVMEEY